MPDPKPRCVHPVEKGGLVGACNKTEAQHGPTTGHTFTLTHVPEPDAGPSAQAEHDRASMPAGEDARVYRPDTFARMTFADAAERVVCGAYNPDPSLPYRCTRPLGHDGDHGEAGIFWGTVPEEQPHPAAMREGDPLEGVLEAGPYRVPDPEVTLRTEMPDGTLVEVRVAHPTHDTVKMARCALVAAEYVMGAIAREDKAAPVQYPVPD